MSGILKQPTYWQDISAASPPQQWERQAADKRFYWVPASAVSAVILLHLDGANGSTSFPDVMGNARFLSGGFATVSTAQQKFGTGSVSFGNPKVIYAPLVSGGTLDIFQDGDDFTIECWIRPNSSGNTEIIWDYGDVIAGYGLRLYQLSGGSLFVQHGSGNSSWVDIACATVLPNNTWVHVAVVRSGGLGTVYVNGVKDNAGGVSQPWPGSYPTISLLRLGASSNSLAQTSWFNGYIDEFRVCRSAVYTANFTPPATAYTDGAVSLNGNVSYIGATALYGSARFAYEIVRQPVTGSLLFTSTSTTIEGVTSTTTQALTGTTGTFAVCMDGLTAFSFGFTGTDGFAYGAEVAVGEGTGDTTFGNVSYNCSCGDDDNAGLETLATLRERFLIHTGYAAQISNPPASAVTLANELLKSAQNFLYRKYPALRTRRLFRWSLQQGNRFYGININDDDLLLDKRLDPYKAIEWVGVRDLNGSWLPMVEGINPSYYTMVEQVSIPSYYEIRDCIEIFPAPQADGYELWIKGHFGLAAFAADTDYTTIDGEVVLLFAVANRKAAQGSPDAKNYAAMATSRLGDLTAGTHGKKRYVPGATVLPPQAMPVFLPTVTP